MSNRRRKLIITAASLLLILLCVAAAAGSLYLAQNVFLPVLSSADETGTAVTKEPLGIEPPVIEITRVFTPPPTTPRPPGPGLNLPFNRPVVTGIIDNSPAAAADFRPGDIITNVNDQAILTSDELIAAIGNLQPGDNVAIIYRRGRETLTARVTLAAHPRNPEQGFLGVELGGNSQFQFGDTGLPDE